MHRVHALISHEMERRLIPHKKCASPRLISRATVIYHGCTADMRGPRFRSSLLSLSSKCHMGVTPNQHRPWHTHLLYLATLDASFLVFPSLLSLSFDPSIHLSPSSSLSPQSPWPPRGFSSAAAPPRAASSPPLLLPPPPPPSPPRASSRRSRTRPDQSPRRRPPRSRSGRRRSRSTAGTPTSPRRSPGSRATRSTSPSAGPWCSTP